MNVKVGFSLILIILLVVVPLLILFIRLCIKKPKLAAIFALIPIALFIIFYFRGSMNISPVNFQPPQQSSQYIQYPNTQPGYMLDNGAPFKEELGQYPNTQAPIWSEGIEDQFGADVYPSKLAAVRELGKRINKVLLSVKGIFTSIQEIEIFQNSQDIELVEELHKVVSQFNPDMKCRIVLDNAFNAENTISIYFFINNSYYSAKENATSGTISANILANQKQQASVPVNFAEKPWVENFAGFLSSRPDKHYIIAKSADSCIAPEEADQQAIKNACYQIEQLAANLHNLNYNSLLESGIVSDKFVQSFNGSAGKIWRETILLDVSSQKLNHLAGIISGAARTRSAGLIKTVLSIIGLFVLITIVYIFLNAATRGYYTWSLRIISVFLVVIFLIIILNIFHFSGGRLGMGGL